MENNSLKAVDFNNKKCYSIKRESKRKAAAGNIGNR
jgi:hypothetical protein